MGGNKSPCRVLSDRGVFDIGNGLYGIVRACLGTRGYDRRSGGTAELNLMINIVKNGRER